MSSRVTTYRGYSILEKAAGRSITSGFFYCVSRPNSDRLDDFPSYEEATAAVDADIAKGGHLEPLS